MNTLRHANLTEDDINELKELDGLLREFFKLIDRWAARHESSKDLCGIPTKSLSLLKDKAAQPLFEEEDKIGDKIAAMWFTKKGKVRSLENLSADERRSFLELAGQQDELQERIDALANKGLEEMKKVGNDLCVKIKALAPLLGLTRDEDISYLGAGWIERKIRKENLNAHHLRILHEKVSRLLQRAKHVSGETSQQYLSCADLARHFNVNGQKLRKRLERWKRTHDNEWVEVADRRRNEPRYLYRVPAVMPLIEQLQRHD